MTTSRKGTTLIELMVALAVFAVFLYIAVGVAGMALSRTAAQRELLVVQGAFRAASEALVQDGRRAGWPNAHSVSPATPLYSELGTSSTPFIVAPLDGSMDDQLAITVPVAGVMHLYVYHLANGTGGQYVARDDYTFTDNVNPSLGVPFNEWKGTSTMLTGPTTQPITATLNQLTHIYFVNRGGTVTLVFVANMRSGGVHAVTYCSNVFVRNYGGNAS